MTESDKLKSFQCPTCFKKTVDLKCPADPRDKNFYFCETCGFFMDEKEFEENYIEYVSDKDLQGVIVEMIDMCIHELKEFSIVDPSDEKIMVLRVPGGWVYWPLSDDRIFVPFPDGIEVLL